MTRTSTLTIVDADALDGDALLALWNAAEPDDLQTAARVLAWWRAGQRAPAIGATLVLRRGEEAVAAALVSCPTPSSGGAAASVGTPPVLGWVDGLIVARGRRRSVDRARLLAAAEEWLRRAGCNAVAIGGGPTSLVRGALLEEPTQRWWRRLGYVEGSSTPLYDLAVDVARYTPPEEAAALPGVVRPAQPRDADEVAALLAAPLQLAATGDGATPLQLSSVRRLLTEGRLADLMLLWTDDGVVGLVQVAYADSHFPLELTYPWGLPRPWGALPLVAVRAGLPLAAHMALVDGALRRMHNTGVNSCVAPGILWTSLYQRAGFVEYRSWRPWVKTL